MNKTNERFFNLQNLFNTLRVEGPITQAELKDKLELQASTISYLVNDLRNKELIINADKNTTLQKVGKPGQPLELDNDFAYFLGLYLEETFIDAHIIGIADKEVFSERMPLLEGLPDTLPEQIIRIIKQFLKMHNKIKGIGIAVKSVVDAKGNLSSFKRTLFDSKGPRIWSIEGFSSTLRKEFPNIHLVVENDANCAAVYYQTVIKHLYENFMIIIVNTEPFGVGCGIIINDKLFRGGNGAAGELFFTDRSIQNLVEQQKIDHAPVKIMQLLKESIIKGIYMIDPEMIYLSGSLFSNISDATRAEIINLFIDIPHPMDILVEGRYSLPAKGAVLLAVEQFANELLASMDRRN